MAAAWCLVLAFLVGGSCGQRETAEGWTDSFGRTLFEAPRWVAKTRKSSEEFNRWVWPGWATFITNTMLVGLTGVVLLHLYAESEQRKKEQDAEQWKRMCEESNSQTKDEDLV